MVLLQKLEHIRGPEKLLSGEVFDLLLNVFGMQLCMLLVGRQLRASLHDLPHEAFLIHEAFLQVRVGEVVPASWPSGLFLFLIKVLLLGVEDLRKVQRHGRGVRELVLQYLV